MTTVSPYRPHNPGHDYYDPGAYLVPLVVSGREPRLSLLNDDATHPAVCLTTTGAIVQYVKSAITARWRREVTGYVQPPCTATMIRHMSKERRRAYYATRPLLEQIL